MKRRKHAAMLVSLVMTLSMGVGLTVMAESQLDEVFVYGDRIYNDEEYAGGLVGRKTNFGILGKQDYMSIPVQVTSITAKSIENTNRPGRSLLEAATLDPAVSNRGGNAYNDVMIRGFYVSPHDYYLDGIPGLMCQSSIPTNFLERIDVISGPATLTNGSSSYGKTAFGAIDLIPKKAGEIPVRKFTETFSGRGTWSESIDIGQRFGENHEWGVRLNADFTKGITERRKENMTSGNIFVNIDYAKEKDRANFFYGHNHVNEMAPDLPLQLGKFNIPDAPRGSTNFQASWANYAYTNDFLGISYEKDLNENLTWFIKGGYHDEDWYSCFESYYPTLIDDKGNFESYIEQVPIRVYRQSLITGFKSNFMTGKIKHNVVFAADKQWSSGWWGDWEAGYDYLYHGNIYDDSIEKNMKPTVDNIEWGTDQKKISKGLSFVDTMEAGKWTFLLGARRQSETVSGGYHGSATSPSFGVMYKLTPELSVYGNWMQGLIAGQEVSKRYKNHGEYLEPVKTTQKEVGFKWDHKKIGATASYFYVDEQLAMEDPVTNTLGYNGRQKSEGFTVSVFGEPLEKLHVMGGFNVMNVLNQGGTYDGNRFAGLPKWNATMALEYDVSDRFSLNSRIIYNSSAYADNANTKKIKSWTRLDLGAKYRWNLDKNPITLSCNVVNLFGRRYWYGAGNNKLYLGAPRTVMVSLGMEF